MSQINSYGSDAKIVVETGDMEGPMARYGQDYSGDRTSWWNQGWGGGGYDKGFGARGSWREGSRARNRDWSGIDPLSERFEGGRYGRWRSGLDESRDSFSLNRGRGYSDAGGFGGGMRGWSGYGPSDRGRGWSDQRFSSSGRRGSRYSEGYGYDEDFGDRIRRGWDRLREQARGMMGRGYDRG